MFRRLIPQENYHSDLKSSNEDPSDYDRGNNYLFRSEPHLRELTELDLRQRLAKTSADASDSFHVNKNICLSPARLRELTEPVDFNSVVVAKESAPSWCIRTIADSEREQSELFGMLKES